MGPTIKFVLAYLILLIVQILVGGSAVFFLRRRNRLEPAWSWPKTLGAFCLLGLLVSAVSLVPFFGRLAAVIVSLFGLQRFSGLTILTTFILSFSLGVLFFILAVVLSRQLQVALLDLGN